MAQLKDLIVTGASRFLGNIYGTLKGNADTATKATHDSAGQPINTTYIKGLSASGKTITYTKGNGTTGTITTQDTTYSNATASAPGLMSKDDKAKLDGITASADAVSFSRSLTSGTKVGTITINGTGTDLYAPTNTDTKNTAGSTDTSSKIFLVGATSQAANPQTYSHDTAYVGTDGCLYSNNTKVSVEGHTHNYAGSSSAGGAANSANKLATARTFRTNLGSTSTASFDGSANVTPGVTGTLGLANGGTGATTAAQARINLGIETTDGTVSSGNADYAEVCEWVDGNTSNENRIGYFVCVDNAAAGTTMRKATASDDIRGVTVTAPAFASGCSPDKFDSSGALLAKYDYVAVMGIVSVIDDGTCVANGRCMPNSSGIATKAAGNYGYQVIERIDNSHILVAVEPGTDFQYRVMNRIDDKHKVFSAVIGTDWNIIEYDDFTLFRYTVSIPGILISDNPHVTCTYDFMDIDNMYKIKEAWGMIWDAFTTTDGIIFECINDKPNVEIPIQIEVIR